MSRGRRSRFGLPLRCPWPQPPVSLRAGRRDYEAVRRRGPPGRSAAPTPGWPRASRRVRPAARRRPRTPPATARAHRHHWSPGCEPGEAELGVRGGQVVADRRGELQELTRHPGAHRVHADVLRPGVAAPVAIEAGERVGVARLEIFAEDVLGHGLFDHVGHFAPAPPPPVKGSPSKRSTQVKEGTGARLQPARRRTADPGPRVTRRRPPRECRRARVRRARAAAASSSSRHRVPRRVPPTTGSTRRGRWTRRRRRCSAGRSRSTAAERGQVRQDEQEGRRGMERLGEPRRGPRPPRRSAAPPPRAAASAARSVTGAQGTRPADPMARYSYQPLR